MKVFITCLITLSFSVLLTAKEKLVIRMVNPTVIDNNNIKFDLEIANASTNNESINLSIVQPQFTIDNIGYNQSGFELISNYSKEFTSMNNYKHLIQNYRSNLYFRLLTEPIQNNLPSVSSEYVKFATIILTYKEGFSFPFDMGLSEVTPNVNISGFVNNSMYPSTFSLAEENLKLENKYSDNTELVFSPNGVTNTKDKNNSFITVTPNPTTDVINVDISTLVGNNGDIELEIVDAAGSIKIARGLDKSKTVHSISLDELSAAPYFVKIVQNGETYTKSVIKIN